MKATTDLWKINNREQDLNSTILHCGITYTRVFPWFRVINYTRNLVRAQITGHKTRIPTISSHSQTAVEFITSIADCAISTSTTRNTHTLYTHYTMKAKIVDISPDTTKSAPKPTTVMTVGWKQNKNFTNQPSQTKQNLYKNDEPSKKERIKMKARFLGSSKEHAKPISVIEQCAQQVQSTLRNWKLTIFPADTTHGLWHGRQSCVKIFSQQKITRTIELLHKLRACICIRDDQKARSITVSPTARCSQQFTWHDRCPTGAKTKWRQLTSAQGNTKTNNNNNIGIFHLSECKHRGKRSKSQTFSDPKEKLSIDVSNWCHIIKSELYTCQDRLKRDKRRSEAI